MDEFRKKIKKRIILSSMGICVGLVLFIALQALLGVTIGLSTIVVYTSVAYVILYIAFYITYMKSVLKDDDKLERLYAKKKETVPYKIITKAVFYSYSAAAAAVAVAAPLFALFIDTFTGVILMFILLIMIGSFAAAYIILCREADSSDKSDEQ